MKGIFYFSSEFKVLGPSFTHAEESKYLGTVGVKVNGWDGGGEGVHFSLVGRNLVLQSTEGLQKNLYKW